MASHGFNGVGGIAPDGAQAWFVKSQGGSVTELEAVDGHWVRVRKHHNHGFCYPAAAVTESTHVWVANDPGGSGLVTELYTAGGVLVKVLKARSQNGRQARGCGYPVSRDSGQVTGGVDDPVIGP
jgi:hypothetical protein